MNMGDLIKFIYYIYNYRLLYYLPKGNDSKRTYRKAERIKPR